MEKLQQTIQTLKVSPLFYLFSSSKELFHSNFWYWMSTIDAKATAAIFGVTLDGDIHFGREVNQKHGEHKSKVDLVIYENEQPKVVIENKVKDFAKEDQLSRIRQSFNNPDLTYILTTLFWENNFSHQHWNVLTYQDISENIFPEKFKPSLNKTFPNKSAYYLSLIEDYKQFTYHLSQLNDALKLTEHYDFANKFQPELFHQLNGLKLWEGYQKVRASHLIQAFEKYSQSKFITWYTINNQKATMDFKVKVEDYRFGIQIENEQYRKFIYGKNADLIADQLLEENVFFTTEFKGRGNKPYLNYGKEFKYQYTKLESPISFNNLFTQIINDLNWILEHQDKILNTVSYPSS